MENQISLEQIKNFSKIYNSNKTNKIIENAITKNGLENACINREIIIENQPVFNIELPESKRYDQQDSYRCWIYAGLNLIKHNIAKNLNMNVIDLELSSNHIAFFDKLEKSNNVYENIINLESIDFNYIHKESIIKYCVADKSAKINDTYITYHYENGKMSVINISENELPQNTGINSALRVEKGKYVIDEKATNDIINEITEMANKLLEKQDRELSEYRKEKHLYRVSENINGSVFLWNITDKPDYEIEEVDFPKELLSKATEGSIFQYINGEYKFYSKDGFDRIHSK